MVYPQPQGQSKIASVTSGTAITVARPDSVAYALGDYIVFALRSQSSTTTAVALPSGVVRLGPAFIPSNAQYRVTGLYGYRVTDPNNVPATFTFTLTGSSASRIVVIALNVRNVANNPVAAFYDSYNGATQTTGVRIPAYATTGDGLTVVIAASEFAANNSETPTVADNDYGTYGYTVAPATLSSGRTAVGMYAREQGTGNTNEFLMQWGTPSGQAAQSITLAGGTYSGGGPVITPLKALYNDGAKVHNATVMYNDGTKLHNLTKVTTVKPGRKVDRLFADDRYVKIAHRGGSRNYKEMTLRGYTQSLIAAARALEVSIARTSDGIYFGLHDDTLNRTTPSLAANYRPAEHTWAEISQLKQTAPATNDTRFGDDVYWRFSDLLQYHTTTTYFVDPKVIGSQYWDEFLNYLLTFPNATNTFVIKYFHTATALALKARALGFKTWGYAYQADVDGTNPLQLSETAYAWTYIGMDYQANDDAWTTTLTIAGRNNQLIIGHICPTLAAAQRCVEQGAAGVMCSGINEVIGFD